MAYGITDFSHGSYVYVSDNTNTYNVSMRNVYVTASGLTLATAFNPPFAAKHARRRYVHSINGGGGGAPVERHYPISTAQIVTATIPTVDGITNFTIKGYRGEQIRAVG
jgi:hypothetical protein